MVKKEGNFGGDELFAGEYDFVEEMFLGLYEFW
jgi:hypothetical protein